MSNSIQNENVVWKSCVKILHCLQQKLMKPKITGGCWGAAVIGIIIQRYFYRISSGSCLKIWLISPFCFFSNKSKGSLCAVYTARLIFFLSYTVPHQIHKNTQVIVAAVLLVFKLHFSHFNLSAFSAWSRCLCGHETLYVILAHVAGVLGQTPDERLRKQFPWMCLLSRPSPLSHALSASFWGWITFLASLQCVIYIGTRSRAHACTRAHTRRGSSDTHTRPDKSPLLPKSR